MNSKASVINQIKRTRLTECRAIHKDLVFLLESATKRINFHEEKANKNGLNFEGNDATPCPKCSNTFDPQSGRFCGTCEECDEIVCEECLSKCNECGSIRCNNDNNHFYCGMVECLRCSEKICDGCVVPVGPLEGKCCELCHINFVRDRW